MEVDGTFDGIGMGYPGHPAEVDFFPPIANPAIVGGLPDFLLGKKHLFHP
jgi:hypothetical protein